MQEPASEKIGRFTFYSREESEARGLIPSDEELARADELLAAFNEKRRNAPPEPARSPSLGLGERWGVDSVIGTEFEGWTRDANDQWYDKDGRPTSHDRDANPGI
ncbi:hypothetical protein [Nocardia beijingensis]|uniref:hypothetical protein n=1 Tax=Nocardia beijingensis TaxID=95162 RepID=UPI00082CCBCF|nr:hypothetical protein [Nocardia beijingensis]